MVYIDYKFTQSPDKNQLKADLTYLSDLVTSKGYKTFVLFRDIRNWGKSSHNRWIHAPIMVKKLFQAKNLVVYIDNNNPSFGLDFELIVAKLLGRPMTIIAKKNVKLPKIINKNTPIIRFNRLSEISSLTI